MTMQDETPDDLSALLNGGSSGPAEVDPVVGRRRRLLGLLIAAIVIAVLFGAPAVYAAWALNAALPAPDIRSQAPAVPVPPAAAISMPNDGAAAISVSGADEYLGAAASGVWQTSGTDEPRPIASISKLITALVVLEARPLSGPDDPGPTITFDEADHDLYDEYYVLGATIAPMPEGSSMSERDALATMLIPSACNYAEAVSTWAFGSQSAFLDATARWLADHGLTGTTIVEPTGIDSDNTSTPSDLLTIGKLAAADPTIAQIVATPSLSLPGPGTITNTNDLLGVDGVTGLKTGNLGEGSYSLLYTATLDAGIGAPLSVTGVVLGGHSRATVNVVVRGTLESIRNGFRQVPVAERGQDLGVITTAWGSTARLVVSADASIPTWSSTPITVTMDMKTPETYREGEVVGSLTWTAGTQTATAGIQIEGSIAPPTEWWRLTHPSELAAG